MNDPTLLYVSDDPEKVRDTALPGILFQAALRNGSIARILIDHVNGTGEPKNAPPLSGRPIRILAWIANLGPAPGTITIARALGDKLTNGMQSGHLATARFLALRERTPGGGAKDVTLAKDATEVLIDVELLPFTSAHPGPPGKPPVAAADGECITGLFDVATAADGNTYELRVIACDPAVGIEAFDTLHEAAGDGKQRRGIFEVPGAGDVKEIPFGERPFIIGDQDYPRAGFDHYPGPSYQGEFGVTKRFSCRIDGGKLGRIAMLAQRAGGGGATATYLIDGDTFESHQIRPTDEYVKVKTFTVAPNATQVVKLTTMAEINSTLPIDLVLGPNVSEIPNRVAQTGSAGPPR